MAAPGHLVLDPVHVGILGATGPAGQALAARLASAGFKVGLGSRSAERAREVCDELLRSWPDHDLALVPVTNEVATEADLVVLATPWEAAAPTASALAARLAGRVVVSMANALTKVGGELRARDLDTGSVTAAVQAAIPESLVAAAFQHLPARSLGDLTGPVEGDVLVCTDHAAAYEACAALIDRVPNLRAFHAGSLAYATEVEAFTAVLLGLNRRYRSLATIRLTGMGTAPAAEG